MSFDSEKLTAEQVKKISFFNGLEGKDLEDISEFLNVKRFNRGYFVFVEGERANEIYFILKGSVKILKQTYEDTNEMVSSLDEDSYFGEMALVDDDARSASVLAETDLVLAELVWDKFLERFSNQPDVIIYVLRNIAKTLSIRLRKTNALYANILPGFKNLRNISNIT